MITDIIRSFCRLRSRPDKELYIRANKAAKRRIRLMEAVEHLEAVTPGTPSAKAAGILTLAWRILRDVSPGDTELVYCALKVNEILSAEWGWNEVPHDIAEIVKSLARRVESVTFITPPREVNLKNAA